MEPEQQHPAVRQLRVVVEAADYDAALAFFRDALGLPESASFAEGPEDRVAILEAGRATLEITSPAHKQVIDRIEANGRPSPAIRLAFEVDDAPETTDRLQDVGGEVISAAVRTPWQSLNSRLNAPAGLQITLFQELLPAPERAAQPGFDIGR
ncbi:VOC family protein [Kocuria sp. SM24M-10]|uniref:VOC family protein n=1 Tax=Kocuria sp. SM24M-10 TaxID=1660349 RepID=UPI00064933DD|nr:VOC family protein [Kocuria sp. SM24M-10]KLU09792.1 glyoxalase [Kocuria sp. SM24M-10]